MARQPHATLFGRFAVLLFALIAVLGVWPRTVGADTSLCKPDGASCRTNQSCCGRVCVNSAPPGKRPFGTCCTPTTCGANCGMIRDGSCPDMLPCGDCPTGQICVSNVCVTTTTTTTVSTTTTTTFNLCGFDEATFLCGGDCPSGTFCGTRNADPSQCECWPNEDLCQSSGLGICNFGACPAPNAFRMCETNPNTNLCECFEPCGVNPTVCSGECVGFIVPHTCAGTPGTCRCCIASDGPCFGPTDCCSDACIGNVCQ